MLKPAEGSGPSPHLPAPGCVSLMFTIGIIDGFQKFTRLRQQTWSCSPTSRALIGPSSAGSIDPGGGGAALPRLSALVHSERIPAAGERRGADPLLHERGGGSTFTLFPRCVKILALRSIIPELLRAGSFNLRLS